MNNIQPKPTRAVDKSFLNQVIEFGCICERKDFQPVGGPSYILEGMDHFKSFKKSIIMHINLIFQVSITLVIHLMCLIFLFLM